MAGRVSKPSSALAEQAQTGLGPRDCEGPAQSKALKGESEEGEERRRQRMP